MPSQSFHFWSLSEWLTLLRSCAQRITVHSELLHQNCGVGGASQNLANKTSDLETGTAVRTVHNHALSVIELFCFISLSL